MKSEEEIKSELLVLKLERKNLYKKAMSETVINSKDSCNSYSDADNLRFIKIRIKALEWVLNDIKK